MDQPKRRLNLPPDHPAANKADQEVTKDDLDVLGLEILRLWTRHRPKVVEGLTKAGTLYAHVLDAEQNTVELEDRLWKQGVNPWAAKEMAWAEYVNLPDLEPSPAPLPNQTPRRLSRSKTTTPPPPTTSGAEGTSKSTDETSTPSDS